MWSIEKSSMQYAVDSRQTRPPRPLYALRVFCCLLLTAYCLLSSGCRQDMHDQPKYKPYAPSNFFEDNRSSRPLVEGTVPRSSLSEESPLARVVMNEQAGAKDKVNAFPFVITAEVLARGRERFNISCTPCHGRLGDGEGMIAKRGFRRPPTFHDDRLRETPVGHLYDVITNGFGAMSSYADSITPRDRWAIVAYIRALQLSQRATRSDMSPEEWQKLNPALPKGVAPGGTPK